MDLERTAVEIHIVCGKELATDRQSCKLPVYYLQRHPVTQEDRRTATEYPSDGRAVAVKQVSALCCLSHGRGLLRYGSCNKARHRPIHGESTKSRVDLIFACIPNRHIGEKEPPLLTSTCHLNHAETQKRPDARQRPLESWALKHFPRAYPIGTVQARAPSSR